MNKIYLPNPFRHNSRVWEMAIESYIKYLKTRSEKEMAEIKSRGLSISRKQNG